MASESMVCPHGEHFPGPWGSPSMAALEGGSFGCQLAVMRRFRFCSIMNPRCPSILSSKVQLGATWPHQQDQKAVRLLIHPTNRCHDVGGDLSYSRSRDFPPASREDEGSTLRPDNNANEQLYGTKVTAPELVRKGGRCRVPSSAQNWSLAHKTSREPLRSRLAESNYLAPLRKSTLCQCRAPGRAALASGEHAPELSPGTGFGPS